ncbi:MAG: PPC domain-containing protein [Anaerolineae bacterium]|nr:PPC domain-containing protein [Anaerolineae bacterium]MDW8298180.1 PPC domain-containing protein [Anaerolineae bacterium]
MTRILLFVFLMTLGMLLTAPSPLSHAQSDAATPTPFMRARPNAEFQPLQRGVPIIGEIRSPDSVERFAVFAAANEVISLGMFPEEGSTLVPRFEVYAPNGERVAIGSAPFAAVIGYRVPATGAYIVFVRAERGRGAYSFWVNSGETLRDLQRGTILPEQPMQGKLLRRADRDVWQVALQSGTPIEVALEPESPTLNLTLEIIAPDGTLLTAVPNGDIPLLYVPSNGTYTFRVYSPQAAAIGAYTLRLRLLGALPTPTFGSVIG